MVDVQLEIICLAGDDLTLDAGRESRAEGSHQPEKYLGSRTMSSSSPLDDLAIQHKGTCSLSAFGSICHQAPDWARWPAHSAGSNRQFPEQK